MTALPSQGSPQGGNVVVLRVGDGTGARSSSATKIFMDVYDSNHNLIAKIPVDDAPPAPELPVTISGTAVGEGQLTLSDDNQYLVCAGYGTPAGLSNVATSSSATVPRVVCRISMGGTIHATTSLGTAFSGSSIRSAASLDGQQFYATGSSGGVQYALFGASTATQINSAAPVDLRVANVHAGQLYVSSATGSFHGVGTVGSGLPTTGGQIPVLLSGFPTVAGPSSHDFFFADANTLYVADDRAAGSGGGIQKWVNGGGTWSLQYTLAVSATLGCRGLSGFTVGGTTTLYATTAETSPTATNELVRVDDAGPTSPFTVAATSPANTVFRGVRYIPQQPSFVVSGTGSPSSGGVPTIASLTSPTVCTTFGISSSNWPPFTVGALVITVGPLLPGIQIPGAQPGALLYVSLPETMLLLAFSDGGGNAAAAIPIPCSAAFLGLQAGSQWFVVDGNLPYPLQFASSPGALITVGL